MERKMHFIVLTKVSIGCSMKKRITAFLKIQSYKETILKFWSEQSSTFQEQKNYFVERCSQKDDKLLRLLFVSFW